MIESDITSVSPNRDRCIRKNRLLGFFAAVLIVLGFVLQWTELLFTRFFVHDGWLFATLLGEIWNIISVSPSGTEWHQNLHYWPLLLVVTGAAILLSRNCHKLPN